MYEEHPVRIEFFGDEVERLMTLHPLPAKSSLRTRSSTYSRDPLRGRTRTHESRYRGY